MRLLVAGLLLCVAGAGAGVGAGSAWAQEDPVLSGTLLAIHDRGAMRIGVREGAVPFSFRNEGGQPIGFSVDLCHGIAEDVAAALHRELLEPTAPAWQSGVRIAYVPVAADERMRLMAARAIDLECGSTTANDERARQVAFSPVFFVAGTKLAVPPGSGAGSWRDLAGKSVGVSAGTTNEAVMKRLAAGSAPPLTVVSLPSVEAAFDALKAGKVQAVASDDILLAGMIAARGESLAVVGDYLSFEPYAIMLAKDDPQFLDLVRASFARQAAEGALRTRYDRWFLDRLPTGRALGLPMGPQLAEIFRALGQPD